MTWRSMGWRACVVVALSLAITHSAQAVPTGDVSVILQIRSGDTTRYQQGKLIVLDWTRDGTRRQFDKSGPPVRWPRFVVGTGDSQYTLQVHRSTPPDSLQVRVWKAVKKSGLPRGEPIEFFCYTVSLEPEDCTLVPAWSVEAGPYWIATLDLPKGWSRYFLATNAMWTEYDATSQRFVLQHAVWISHVRLQS